MPFNPQRHLDFKTDRYLTTLILIHTFKRDSTIHWNKLPQVASQPVEQQFSSHEDRRKTSPS